jgi:subtilisin family serine protease
MSMRQAIHALTVTLSVAVLALVLARPAAERPPHEPVPASAASATQNAPAVPDELLVKVEPGGALALRLVDHLVGAREVGRLESLGVVRVRMEPGTRLIAAARLYESLPFVEYVEPNYVLPVTAVPNDPMYGAYQSWYYDLIEAPEAWDLGPGTAPAVVAVLDTGIDVEHPDLQSKIWVNTDETAGNGLDDDANGCIDDVHGCNFVDPDTADIACVGRPPGPSSDVTDDDGHGTFVAGVIGASTDNGVGVAGTADGVVLMPVKVLACTGGGTAADIAAGILYAAENGAQVINMSFGAHLESDTIRDALVTAHDEFGVVLVAGAGNSGIPGVLFPANLPQVIAVGASDHERPDEQAWFSSWGPEVDVVAPGVDIVSTVPTELCGRNWRCISSLPYSEGSGTSFAAPQVSGLAGLLLSRNPDLSNDDVRAIIKATAEPLSDGLFLNWAGSGRIRMRQALEFNPEDIPTGSLSPGCNMVTLTFASGTDAATVAAAVSPPDALDTIWRLDNVTRSFQAFRPLTPAVSDLQSLDLLDAVFLCLSASADIAMPTASLDMMGLPISRPLGPGCNAVGLSFPDGTTPSQVAGLISPPDVFQSMWRLNNTTGSFQAYMAAAPAVSDLTSLRFLDAVFICTTGPGEMELPAVISEG